MTAKAKTETPKATAAGIIRRGIRFAIRKMKESREASATAEFAAIPNWQRMNYRTIAHANRRRFENLAETFDWIFYGEAREIPRDVRAMVGDDGVVIAEVQRQWPRARRALERWADLGLPLDEEKAGILMD